VGAVAIGSTGPTTPRTPSTVSGDLSEPEALVSGTSQSDRDGNAAQAQGSSDAGGAAADAVPPAVEEIAAAHQQPSAATAVPIDQQLDALQQEMRDAQLEIDQLRQDNDESARRHQAEADEAQRLLARAQADLLQARQSQREGTDAFNQLHLEAAVRVAQEEPGPSSRVEQRRELAALAQLVSVQGEVVHVLGRSGCGCAYEVCHRGGTVAVKLATQVVDGVAAEVALTVHAATMTGGAAGMPEARAGKAHLPASADAAEEWVRIRAKLDACLRGLAAAEAAGPPAGPAPRLPQRRQGSPRRSSQP